MIAGQNSSRNPKLKENGAKSKTLQVQQERHTSSLEKEHSIEIDMNAVF